MDRFDMVEMDAKGEAPKPKKNRASRRMSAVIGDNEESYTLKSTRRGLERRRRLLAKMEAESQPLAELKAKYDAEIEDVMRRWNEAAAPHNAKVEELQNLINSTHAKLSEAMDSVREVDARYNAEHAAVLIAQHNNCGSKLIAIKSVRDRVAALDIYIKALELQSDGWLVTKATSKRGVVAPLGSFITKSAAFTRRYRQRFSQKRRIVADIILRPGGVYAMLIAEGETERKYTKVIDVSLLETLDMSDSRLAVPSAPQTPDGSYLRYPAGQQMSTMSHPTPPTPCKKHSTERPLLGSRWCADCGAPVLWVCDADPTHFERASKCRCMRANTKWVSTADVRGQTFKFEASV